MSLEIIDSIIHAFSSFRETKILYRYAIQIFITFCIKYNEIPSEILTKKKNEEEWEQSYI